jgi:hypothetical protein
MAGSSLPSGRTTFVILSHIREIHSVQPNKIELFGFTKAASEKFASTTLLKYNKRLDASQVSVLIFDCFRGVFSFRSSSRSTYTTPLHIVEHETLFFGVKVIF